MAKIKVGGVQSSNNNHSILVVLVEEQIRQGQPVEQPLGEAVVTIPSGTPPGEAKQKIIDAAQGIMDAHKDAIEARRRLEQVSWPDIT